MLFKIVWHSHEDKQISQCNTIKNLKNKLLLFSQPTFAKYAKTILYELSFQAREVVKLAVHMQGMKSIHYIKNNLEYIICQNIHAKTLRAVNLFKEK